MERLFLESGSRAPLQSTDPVQSSLIYGILSTRQIIIVC
jgi:hypothetical protein